jgi:hypothetical protein
MIQIDKRAEKSSKSNVVLRKIRGLIYQALVGLRIKNYGK